MAQPFIFINTYAVKEGRLDEYKQAFQQVAELAENTEPRLIHIGCYLNDDGSESTTVQIHPDAESMGFHMQVSADHINAAREFLDFSRMSIQIYGRPNEAILDQMRELAGAGVPVSIMEPAVTFDRLPDL